MVKSLESCGAGRIIRNKDYTIELKNIFSQIEKIENFNDRIEYLESYIKSFIDSHEDVKDRIRNILFKYHYPDLFSILCERIEKKTIPVIDDTLEQQLAEKYKEIDLLINKAGGFFKDYKSKRISFDRINFIDDVIDKIEQLEGYRNELAETDFIFEHDFPEEVLQKFPILEANKLITKNNGKPNFKHLRHAIAFFDLCHIKYDISDYGKLNAKDGKKNKIIAESILIQNKKPSKNNIAKTRGIMMPSNKYKQDIETIFPDLSISEKNQ